MNIRSFMQNPAGKGTVIPGKEAILDILNRRYITLTKSKPIEVNIYTSNDIVFYHALVSTESDTRDNTYDIVLKFSPTTPGDVTDGSIRNYDMKVFSNCPSFTYTYAYVANLNGVMVEELTDKFDYNVIKRPPVSRNPGMVMGYEKSIYFVCKHLLENNVMLTKQHIRTNSQKINKNVFKAIRKDSVIEEEITRSKNVHKENKKAAQDKRASDIMSNRKTRPNSKSSVNYIKKKTPIQKKTVKAKRPTKSTIKPINKK